MRPIISIQGLGKQYRRGARQSYRGTLRERIAGLVRPPWRKPRTKHAETFWALHDVSFDVFPGEVVGLIGRNGAGKSTLLKLLSRITEPTAGRVQLYGRVGTLLEVGTGFHPELTGRENIFLNGAILGMKKSEIQRRFDAIVEFSEIGAALDTSVKHYSSGMYMKLAFSVAAHLNPEILFVDEVLAVGDAAFQNKCVEKMLAIARGGRTIVLVSHNMSTIRRMCKRVLLLDAGSLVYDASPPDKAIAAYSDLAPAGQAVWTRPSGGHVAPGPLTFRSIAVSVSGEQPDLRLRVTLEMQSAARHPVAFLALDIHDFVGTPICQALPDGHAPAVEYSSDTQLLEIEIDIPPLVPGSYRLQAWTGPDYCSTFDRVECGPVFTIDGSPVPGRTFPHTPDHGFFVPASRMSVTSGGIRA